MPIMAGFGDPVQQCGPLQFAAIERQADRDDLFIQPRRAGPRFHIENQDRFLRRTAQVRFQPFAEVADELVSVFHQHDLPRVPHRDSQQRVDNRLEIGILTGQAGQTQVVGIRPQDAFRDLFDRFELEKPLFPVNDDDRAGLMFGRGV